MDTQTETQPLVCPSHTTHYAAMAIVGMLIGTIATYSYVAMRPVDPATTYEAGFAAAKKLVEESSVGPMIQSMGEVRAVTGTITSVSGSRIALRVQSVNPFEDQNLLNRAITITSDTKIVKLSQKDPIKFQSEMNAFLKASQSASNPSLTPPAPYTSTSITGADLKVGDTISVTAGDNIKSSKEFSATEIQVQPVLSAAIN